MMMALTMSRHFPGRRLKSGSALLLELGAWALDAAFSDLANIDGGSFVQSGPSILQAATNVYRLVVGLICWVQLSCSPSKAKNELPLTCR